MLTKQQVIEMFDVNCKDKIYINHSDIENVLQQNRHPVIIDVQEKATNIADRLQAEIAKANTDNASNAILRIGYSADVEVQYEQVQSILRIINDAIPNVNLVWGYGIDDKLPDGHCSILLLIG